MGNIDNKEKEFAETLKLVTRTARENRNVISEEEVKEAFSELDLSEEQLGMVYEYLRNHKIGVGEPAPVIEDDFSEEEKNYLDDYISSLEQLPKLSDGEKEAVKIAALAGERDAQLKLVDMYLPLVVDVAKMYADQGVYIEDLIGEGNYALARGVNMLDAVGEPQEIESFLYKLMLDAMENAIEQDLEEAAGSQKVLKLVQEVADKAKELADDLRRKVTVKELMDETGWDEEKIRSAIKFSGDNIEDLDSGEKKKS